MSARDTPYAANGDPAGIRVLAATYHSLADDTATRIALAERARDALEAQHGEAATALTQQLTDQVGALKALRTDCDHVGDILTTYADEVEDIVYTADNLTANAADARDRGLWASSLSPANSTGWNTTFYGLPGRQGAWEQAVTDWYQADHGLSALAERRETLDARTAAQLEAYRQTASAGVGSATGSHAAAGSGTGRAAPGAAEAVTRPTAPPTPDPGAVTSGHGSRADDGRHGVDDEPHDAVGAPVVGTTLAGVPLSVCFAANRKRIRHLMQRLVDQVPAVALPHPAFFRRALEEPTVWRDADGREHSRHGAAVVLFDPATSTYVTYYGPLDEHGNIPAWVRHVGVLDAGTAATAEQLRRADERGATLYDACSRQAPTALFVVSHAPVLHDLAGSAPGEDAQDAAGGGAEVARLLGSITRPEGSTLTVVGSDGAAALSTTDITALHADGSLYVDATGAGSRTVEREQADFVTG